MNVFLREQRDKEYEWMSMDDARGIAARIWCESQHSGKTMDVALAESIAERLHTLHGWIMSWKDAAARHVRNEEYYRGLLIQIGEIFGDEAKRSDDGSMQQDVLCAKVPELVKQLMSEVRPDLLVASNRSR